MSAGFDGNGGSGRLLPAASVIGLPPRPPLAGI